MEKNQDATRLIQNGAYQDLRGLILELIQISIAIVYGQVKLEKIR